MTEQGKQIMRLLFDEALTLSEKATAEVDKKYVYQFKPETITALKDLEIARRVYVAAISFDGNLFARWLDSGYGIENIFHRMVTAFFIAVADRQVRGLPKIFDEDKP